MADFIENLDGTLSKVAGPDGRKTVRTRARAVEGNMTDLMTDTMMRRDFDPALAAYVLAAYDTIQVPMLDFIVSYLHQITIDGGDPEVVAKANKMLDSLR